MKIISLRTIGIWCVILMTLALMRVHFRVVTTNVAYRLGHLKNSEATLLEKRAVLQADLAKLTGKRQLQTLSDSDEPVSAEKTGVH